MIRKGYKTSFLNSTHSEFSKNDQGFLCLLPPSAPSQPQWEVRNSSDLLSMALRRDCRVLKILYSFSGFRELSILKEKETPLLDLYLTKKPSCNSYITKTEHRNRFNCLHIERKGRTLHNESPAKAIIVNKTHR